MKHTQRLNGRMCAQDKRFADINEAIGLLQYMQEQEATRVDDLIVRVDQLEKARAKGPVMDGDGVLVSHDAWDAMERELESLRAFRASIPCPHAGVARRMK